MCCEKKRVARGQGPVAREKSRGGDGGQLTGPWPLATSHSTRGFSLMEVMVVLVIIALLASVIGISVSGYVDRARSRKAAADLAVLHGGVKAYYADHGRYPSASEGLDALVPGYIEQLTKDPWGNAYQYEIPGQENAFEIVCFGADGSEGGDGIEADLTNWSIKEGG